MEWDKFKDAMGAFMVYASKSAEFLAGLLLLLGLSLQLKQLEKPPVRVVYKLTAFGKNVIPVLEALTTWGNQVVKEKGEFVHALK